MQTRVYAIVSGRVQGVGYRWFIQHHAEQLGLSGYVRNLPDGRVEMELQGETAMVEALLEKARIGPWAAQVSSLKTEVRPVQPLAQPFFEIRR
ncbi:MAG: acylphosphatase [Chloroherpetonaceae bacterium]|nr:acylphosphatase [Chloroherpetonaceae bacterium]MCS7210409.1 acylphosphatase [Chloroherpetonaceae bacterium]MDW8020012.1 acylphosphatase [Chloroherpetonaceae bacterium]MDW8465820.1 acylphosphatase [Chloroherpetonaceae bacterium]